MLSRGGSIDGVDGCEKLTGGVEGCAAVTVGIWTCGFDDIDAENGDCTGAAD